MKKKKKGIDRAAAIFFFLQRKIQFSVEKHKKPHVDIFLFNVIIPLRENKQLQLPELLITDISSEEQNFKIINIQKSVWLQLYAFLLDI